MATIKENGEKPPDCFQGKILWNIFGPVKDEKTDEWRIRRNNELEGLLLKENTLGSIQSRGL